MLPVWGSPALIHASRKASSSAESACPTSGIVLPSPAPCVPCTFCDRKLDAASPGITRFLLGAMVDAMLIRFAYEAPARRSRLAALIGPWQVLTAQPCAPKMRCWTVSKVLPVGADPPMDRWATNDRFGTPRDLTLPSIVLHVDA